MTKNTMISTIMCIYKEEKLWIEDAVQSILNQTLQNIELIIIIDNPNLDQIIDNWLNDLAMRDKRIRIIKNKNNIGLAMSLNKGLKVSEGFYVARMDSDDISDNQRFEKEINVLLNNNADMVYSGKTNIDEYGNIIGCYENIPEDHSYIKKILQYGNCINHPTVIIKRSVLEDIGGYRNFKQSQDYDLWLRVIENGYKIVGINESLLLYRIRTNGISGSRPYMQYKTMEFIRNDYFKRLKGKSNTEYIDKLDSYLEKSKAYDILENKKFSKMIELTQASISDFKNKKIPLIKMIKAWNCNRNIFLKYVYNSLCLYHLERCMNK